MYDEEAIGTKELVLGEGGGCNRHEVQGTPSASMDVSDISIVERARSKTILDSLGFQTSFLPCHREHTCPILNGELDQA